MPTCSWCNGDAPITAKHRKDMYRKTGRAYCSDECRDKWVRRNAAETMAATNRRYASRRMTEHNPMARAGVREKVSDSLRARGWKPKVRGGNGCGPTPPQLALSEALGWPMEVVVATKVPRGQGYPTNYKLDLAHPSLKVAIEVDGNSHHSRREIDRKKDDFLRGRGWIVLRFTNREVTERLADCVRAALSTTSRLRAPTPTSPAA